MYNYTKFEWKLGHLLALKVRQLGQFSPQSSRFCCKFPSEQIIQSDFIKYKSCRARQGLSIGV